MFVFHRSVLQSVSRWPVVFVQDRHAVAQQLPLIDDQQDYELLGGHEADGQTVITFRRRLETCDDNDYFINVISNLESVFHSRVDKPASTDSSA